MLLKPKYLRAVLVTFLQTAVFVSLVTVLDVYIGEEFKIEDALGMLAIAGSFLSIAVCVMFTPRELYYDEEGFAIKAGFPGSATYTWDKFQAYSYWSNGTFLLKFDGKQSFQIIPSAFNRAEWKAFIKFLRVKFPEKRTMFWFGPIPIRFGK